MREQSICYKLSAILRMLTTSVVSAQSVVITITLILLATSACTLGPHDQERVHGKTAEIDFWGGALTPGANISIESLDPSTRNWTQIENALSVGWPYQTGDGSDLYLWRKRVVIPQQFWAPGIFGYRARVRARIGDINLVSAREDVGTCMMQNNNPADFVLNCQAPGSPVVRVYTDDYVDVDAGCTPQAEALIKLVNDEREAHGLARIPVSPSLCAVGQAHAMDLSQNRPHAPTECNLHSWSDQGDWTQCCYTRPDDGSHPQAACMWNKPKELTGYPGNGYEDAAAGCSDAECALQLWRNSTGHWDVIMNRSTWANRTWRAIGAGFSGGYALLWFGEERDPANP
jgi:hypothetical protein